MPHLDAIPDPLQPTSNPVANIPAPEQGMSAQDTNLAQLAQLATGTQQDPQQAVALAGQVFTTLMQLMTANPIFAKPAVNFMREAGPRIAFASLSQGQPNDSLFGPGGLSGPPVPITSAPV